MKILARMSWLIKNLLDLSRLELDAALTRELFSLSDLFFSATEDFDAMLLEQEVRLDRCFSGMHLITGDREKMRRVLINLVDNAVRYNHRGGEIRCLLETGAAGETVVTVANTGPFIDQADHARIFDQFYRCEKSRSPAYGGVGLGLAIVKRIVELHGGRIAAESRGDGWNVFRVLLFPPSC